MYSSFSPQLKVRLEIEANPQKNLKKTGKKNWKKLKLNVSKSQCLGLSNMMRRAFDKLWEKACQQLKEKIFNVQTSTMRLWQEPNWWCWAAGSCCPNKSLTAWSIPAPPAPPAPWPPPQKVKENPSLYLFIYHFVYWTENPLSAAAVLTKGVCISGY